MSINPNDPTNPNFLLFNNQMNEEIDEDEKEEDTIRENEEGELKYIFSSSMRYTQIFAIVISLLIYFILNYIYAWSEYISIYIQTGEFLFDTNALVTLLVNLIVFVIIIGIFFFIPKFISRKNKEIYYILIGFSFSLISQLIIKIYNIEINFNSISQIGLAMYFFLFIFNLIIYLIILSKIKYNSTFISLNYFSISYFLGSFIFYTSNLIIIQSNIDYFKFYLIYFVEFLIVSIVCINSIINKRKNRFR